MDEQWHYSRQGEQAGPVSVADLKQLAATGQLSPDDLVWKEGMPDWVAARTQEGLFLPPNSQPAPSVRMVGPQSLPAAMRTPQQRKVGFVLGLGILLLPIVFVWFLLRNGHSLRSRIIGFVWLALFLIAVSNNAKQVDVAKTDSNGQAAASDDAAPPSQTEAQAVQAEADAAAAAAISVSAGELIAAYDSNEVTADQRFRGKSLLVTGVVYSVTKSEIFGYSISARLAESADDFDTISAELINQQDAQLLQKGQRVTFLCKGGGNPTGLEAQLDGCVLQ